MALFLARIGFVILAFVVPLVLANRYLAGERNLRVVEPGVLYRSGQMPLTYLQRIVHDYGIRTVVNLRESGEDVPEEVRKEEDWCRGKSLYYFTLPVLGWESRPGESEAPAMVNVRQLLQILDEPKYHPVLVHCYRGVHRTGIYCAVCRMERQGWSVDRAVAEMRACGYREYDQHQDVQNFLQNYRRQRRSEKH